MATILFRKKRENFRIIMVVDKNGIILLLKFLLIFFLLQLDHIKNWIILMPLKFAIFNTMSWKYGFNIIRGSVIWIWNQIHDISIANVPKSRWIKKASAVSYKQQVVVNELKHIILKLFFTNSKIILCYPRQKLFF